MKYVVFLIAIFICTLPVHAVTTDASASATPTATINKKVEDLKDRLATKVAQLSQSERRAFYGTVKSTTISTLTMETTNKNLKIELTDDIKVFQILKGKRTELTTENVEKGDVITVFGTWDTAVEALSAKVIFIQAPPSAPRKMVGTITNVTKSDYTFSVHTGDNKEYIVDFETFTKTNLWNKDNGIEKGGFSKLTMGDTVFVEGTDVPKKENRVSATRILILGSIIESTSPSSSEGTEKEASNSSEKPSATPSKSPTPTVKP